MRSISRNWLILVLGIAAALMLRNAAGVPNSVGEIHDPPAISGWSAENVHAQDDAVGIARAELLHARYSRPGTPALEVTISVPLTNAHLNGACLRFSGWALNDKQNWPVRGIPTEVTLETAVPLNDDDGRVSICASYWRNDNEGVPADGPRSVLLQQFNLARRGKRSVLVQVCSVSPDLGSSLSMRQNLSEFLTRFDGLIASWQ